MDVLSTVLSKTNKEAANFYGVTTFQFSVHYRAAIDSYAKDSGIDRNELKAKIDEERIANSVLKHIMPQRVKKT